MAEAVRRGIRPGVAGAWSLARPHYGDRPLRVPFLALYGVQRYVGPIS